MSERRKEHSWWDTNPIDEMWAGVADAPGYLEYLSGPPYTVERRQTKFLTIQAITIRELRAENALLRKQIEERKPKGGRPQLEDKLKGQIEADLAAGYTMRAAASRAGVSAMTVSRIAARMKARAEKATA